MAFLKRPALLRCAELSWCCWSYFSLVSPPFLLHVPFLRNSTKRFGVSSSVQAIATKVSKTTRTKKMNTRTSNACKRNETYGLPDVFKIYTHHLLLRAHFKPTTRHQPSAIVHVSPLTWTQIPFIIVFIRCFHFTFKVDAIQLNLLVSHFRMLCCCFSFSALFGRCFMFVDIWQWNSLKALWLI